MAYGQPRPWSVSAITRRTAVNTSFISLVDRIYATWLWRNWSPGAISTQVENKFEQHYRRQAYLALFAHCAGNLMNDRSGKRVLVVEDEVAVRNMLRFTLERADFIVAEAGDVQAARLSIAACRPDIVLLDWMLPHVSGLEFARELRRDELTTDLPVIMVTARNGEGERV